MQQHIQLTAREKAIYQIGHFDARIEHLQAQRAQAEAILMQPEPEEITPEETENVTA